jgi:thiol-disulfide isomerase/thioredoxin
MEILVIGTEPPCVRCQRAFQLAEEVAQQLAVDIKVRKISFNSEEAKKYGKVVTGHDIAVQAKMTVDTADRGEMQRLVQVWSKELDDKLMPYKEKAEEMGYLMTPVLLMNGKVKAMGFVPDKEQILEWAESELRQ